MEICQVQNKCRQLSSLLNLWMYVRGPTVTSASEWGILAVGGEEQPLGILWARIDRMTRASVPSDITAAGPRH